MKLFKKTFILTLIFVQCAFCFATSARYQDENYIINVHYNDTVIPGDAIFVRMEINTPKNHKKNKSDSENQATLQFIQEKDKKILEKAPFYSITKKKSTTYAEMLCGVPISPWLKTDKEDGFSLKVIFKMAEDENAKEFYLPVTFKNKDFPQEILDLNEANSNIKQNYSPERMAQIEKLNKILYTANSQNVFSLKKFICPTASTRHTAYFGDRRTYVYTNGEKSTSLHYGNDYGVPEGSEVKSCQEGKVVMAEWRISTGYSIVIEHLPGLYSLYYHLSSMNVKPGDYVKQNQLIGKSGSTGLATGPHLHWEMRLNAGAVRPEFFMEDFTFSEDN